LLHASYGGKPGRECTVAPPGGNYRRPGVAVFSTACSKSISLTLPCRPRAKSVVPSPSWRRSPRRAWRFAPLLAFHCRVPFRATAGRALHPNSAPPPHRTVRPPTSRAAIPLGRLPHPPRATSEYVQPLRYWPGLQSWTVQPFVPYGAAGRAVCGAVRPRRRRNKAPTGWAFRSAASCPKKMRYGAPGRQS